MLLISIPVHKLQHIHPTIEDGTPHAVEINGKKTLTMKSILDALIQDPATVSQDAGDHYGHRTNDQLEYAMPLTTAYALDPHNGPRIYSFNAADPAKLKAYEDARDALFIKIKKHLKSK